MPAQSSRHATQILPDDAIKLRAAARLLHCSESTARQYGADGRLAIIRVGGAVYTTPAACREFVERCNQKADGPRRVQSAAHREAVRQLREAGI